MNGDRRSTFAEIASGIRLEADLAVLYGYFEILRKEVIQSLTSVEKLGKEGLLGSTASSTFEEKAQDHQRRLQDSSNAQLTLS